MDFKNFIIDNIVPITLFMSIVITLILSVILNYISNKKGAYRVDNENKKIPKFTGGIVPIAFIINFGILLLLETQLGMTFDMRLIISILIGITYFTVLGYIFDNSQIVGKKKIIYELIGVAIVSAIGPKINIVTNPFGGYILITDYIGIIATMIWYFAVINSVNVCRAIDRLSSGIVFIMSIAILGVAVINGNAELMMFSSILLGISLVISVLNINVNNITGMIFGFILALLGTNYLIKSVFTLFFAILVLGVPLFNLLYVVYKRLRRGTIITVRDDEHLFYKLKNGGYTTSEVLGTMYVVTFALVVAGFAMYKFEQPLFALVGIVIIAYFCIEVERRPEKKGKITVMSIFGTRPEAIKMAPVIKVLDQVEDINNVVCVTGQHKEMLYQVLDIYDIKPKYDLDIMRNRQTLIGISSRILKVLEKVVKREKPDLILVHGDTTSTFIGAFLGFCMQVKVGHVEAGLRTYNRREPFPEEMNRVLTGALADLHFSPSEGARENLLKEGVDPTKIFLTGNTAVDSTKYTYRDNYIFREKLINQIDFNKYKVIMMTAHRRENLGKPLENICKAVRRIVQDNKDVVVVYAVHKNPAVREVVYKYLKGVDRIYLVEPVDVMDMHNLMKRSYLALTDSGGLQEEAPSFNLPTVVLRNVTERPEGLATGILKLAGTDEQKIYDITSEILHDESVHDKMAYTPNPYGDGFAAERIRDAICYSFGLSNERPQDFNIGKDVYIKDDEVKKVKTSQTEILGVKIDNVTMNEAVNKIFNFFEEDGLHIVHTTNPEFILTAQKDEEYKTILNSAALAVPDGIGVVISSKFQKNKISNRVSGCDLAYKLMEKMEGTNYSVCIIGCAEERFQKALKNIKKKYPNLKVTGRNGYFKDEEDEEVIKFINDAHPDLLLFGLGGIPKQEKWIWKYKDRLNVKVSIGVGGSIDVMSGEVKRAPKIYQKLCLEWLYRTLSEPKKRLPRVYRLPYFVLLSMGEAITKPLKKKDNK